MINQNLLLAGDDAYNLTKSLRFRSSASAYLNKSYIFGTSANDTSLVKKTYSFWIKRGTLGTDQMILSNYTSAGNLWQIAFDTSDRLYIFQQLSSSITLNKATTQVFRDPASWYNVVIIVDTTLATAEDRFQIWVNNTRVTSWSTNTIAAQNANALSYFTYTSGTWIGNIGRRADALYYFDGYLAEFNVIDGQALTTSSFGSTNATTGVWQPAKYTGTYGTNGFYLPFTNTASTTALGYDFSPNGNNWTTNNFSISSNSTYDSMTDVPTLTNATSANYCVLNPVYNQSAGTGSNGTPSNGNLDLTYNSGSTYYSGYGTISVQPNTGKYYFEVLINTSPSSTSNIQIGLLPGDQKGRIDGQETGTFSVSLGFYNSCYVDTSTIFSGLSGSLNGIMQIAIDTTTMNVWYGYNNTWYNSSGGTTGNPSTGANPTATLSSITRFPTVAVYNNSASANFGQRPFSYTPPSGYVALNTFNLPTSTIVKGNQHFNIGLYTGNGSASALAVSGVANPDFVWIKGRSVAASHALYDTIRGFGKRLYSNATNSEYDYGSAILAPTSTGFNLTTSDADHNTNAATYVGWQWQAGQGSTSSNISGSITSTTSVNATAGFSVVTWTGNGVNGATVGHGLGVAPKLIIVKVRNTSGANWYVYHASNGATPQNNCLFLDSTSASQAVPTAWNNTAPTSNVFSVANNNAVNGSTLTYVAYCWAAITGFSAFGSYTGNGSTDGPFVYTGFRPRFVLFKESSTIGQWLMLDTARPTYQTPDMQQLFSNLSDAETTSTGNTVDFLSNGFKTRSTGRPNTSGATYIYAAFAENPFKNALAR